MATQDVNLAMPVGLPAPNANAQAHYQQLATRLTASVATGNVVRAWIADEAAYDALHAMSTGFLTFVPTGGSGPGGAAVGSPMLVLKLWLWDYLELRRNAAPSAPPPKLIGYGNADAGDVALTVRAELASNTRYQSLTAQQRTQAETDFLAGTLKLLVSAGTRIGRARVDLAPPPPAQSGWRRLELTFFGASGAALDPSLCIDLWGLISGPLVRGHPLLSSLARPVMPSVAGLEGGNRIRITGTNLVVGTTVTIGGQSAIDVEVSADGSAVYATAPPGSAGAADVGVTVPGQSTQTHSEAITYVSDILATARAAITSYAIHLTEIRTRAQALADAGQLDTNARALIRIEVDLAGSTAGTLIANRHVVAGRTAPDPDVGEVWEDAQADLRAILENINAIV